MKTEEKSLTKETLFFDTDCISAFLWIDDTSIVAKLYNGRIAIPTQVYTELSSCSGRASILKERIDTMVHNGQALIIDMDIDSKEYVVFYELALDPPKGELMIGKGEAACIALAKERGGILASNNFRDTKKYIEKYGLKYTTTADIILEAYNKKLLSHDEAENMWQEMLKKRRRLGALSFKDYLSKHK
ncbi:MAG: hypothetical protein J6M92_02450 [Oribacterium sp.]|nr:hypothetical protein [Oribacterium sp.]